MANVLTVIFSPLNISLPTLEMFQVWRPKIADKILRLKLESRLCRGQVLIYSSLPQNWVKKMCPKKRRGSIDAFLSYENLI